ASLLVGCGGGQTPTNPQQPEPSVGNNSGALVDKEDGEVNLRIGVMAAADSAPIYLAEEKGYFDTRGIDVEIETFTNGATKQSSIQAGELEGSMVSMIQYLNNKQAGLPARITTTTDGVFPVVLSPQFEEKKDVKVGLMEVSVVNYLADKYLTDYNMEKVFINEMPVRLQMLMAGELDMAILPEPMASKAQMNGLEKRVYGNPEDFTPNVMIFTDEVIANYPEAVKAFHDGYNQAVAEINANTELGKAILIDELDLDPQVGEYMVLPIYNETRLPDEAFVNDVKGWTENLTSKTFDLPYNDLVSEIGVK
ncbi:MAG: ABC transporter substrate-binding protein, partial [Cellulosilyticaceae bacterium]